MFERLKQFFSPAERERQLHEQLEKLRQRLPVPVFWLFGRTQSGKTSVIKYLTGASDAEIGQGFQPCTRFSRQYRFPTEEAPLLSFLDTRGLEEPGYHPAEDIARFQGEAHVVLVTVKALDHAQEVVLTNLRALRKANPQRPVILLLTTLHEAYPQQQHPAVYPFDRSGDAPEGSVPEDLRRSIGEQKRRFEGLVDFVVPLDLTPLAEGFEQPNFGGPELRQVLLEVLPEAYRQTLILFDQAGKELSDLYARHTLPYLVGYSTLGATAGAIPIPWLDVLILPGIQTRMIHHLAQLYGQPLSAERLREFAGAVGVGMLTRAAVREAVKVIPFVGSVVGAAMAGASTFALGKAFCYYYSAVLKGHVPNKDDLSRYYREEERLARQLWGRGTPGMAAATGGAPATAAAVSDGSANP
jgi:uncharacterized protein (DUF697 family)/predicted GTPase